LANTFFIGDTHFGHKNIIRFDKIKEHRRFETIEEHDAELVRRWNSVVRPKDIVWHLGDFCFGRKSLEVAGFLNGDKRLVMGNHDRYPTVEYLRYFSKVLGAVEVKGMILTHIPVHVSQLDCGRYTHNIHGHLHTYVLADERYINVSAEQVNLTPISLDELNKLANTM
jgi:calcineurin-like phosphoesterase family protein